MKEPFVELTCTKCGKTFLRHPSEHRRSKSQGRAYCSRSCLTSYSNSHLRTKHGSTKGLVPDNKKDELSPFRWYLARIRQRQPDAGLTLPDLQGLWEQQRGLCALSGLPMWLPETTGAHDTGVRNPWKASLDRLDPNKGYALGNIRFVTTMGNFCRNSFSDEDVRAFCRAVVAHHTDEEERTTS